MFFWLARIVSAISAGRVVYCCSAARICERSIYYSDSARERSPANRTADTLSQVASFVRPTKKIIHICTYKNAKRKKGGSAWKNHVMTLKIQESIGYMRLLRLFLLRSRYIACLGIEGSQLTLECLYDCELSSMIEKANKNSSSWRALINF